jgi:hypothetical protein
LVAFGVCTFWGGGAQAQLIGIELIGPFILPSGGVFEQFYSNEFDLNHPKKLTFQGSFINQDPINEFASIQYWFDWIDANGVPHTSPLEGVVLGPGGSAFAMPTFTISYCPPEVSLHIENGQGAPVFVQGTFIHECIVPEPGTVALSGLATIGLVAFGRRRR